MSIMPLKYRFLFLLGLFFSFCIISAQESFDYTYIKTYGDHKIPIERVTFTPDGEYIISGDFNGIIYFWSVNQDGPVKRLNAHKNRINKISFSEDGRFIATASSDKTAKVWTYPECKLIRTYNSDHNISFIDFHPNSRCVYFGGQDGSIYKNEFLTEQSAYPVFHNLYFITSATISPDRNHLVFSAGFSIKFLNFNTSRIEKEIGSCSDYMNQILFTPKGSLISWCEDGTLNYWDYKYGYYGLLFSKKSGSPGYSNLAVSNDNKFLLTGNSDFNTRVWDLSTKTLLGELKGHMDLVRSFTFSPDDKYIASCSYDGNVILWGPEQNAIEESKTQIALREKADSTVKEKLDQKDLLVYKANTTKSKSNKEQINELLVKAKEMEQEMLNARKATLAKVNAEQSKEIDYRSVNIEADRIAEEQLMARKETAIINHQKEIEKTPVIKEKAFVKIKEPKIVPQISNKNPVAFSSPDKNISAKTDKPDIEKKVNDEIKQFNFEKAIQSPHFNDYDPNPIKHVALMDEDFFNIEERMEARMKEYEKTNTPKSIENRKVIPSKTIHMGVQDVELFVWDNVKVDGDQISLIINGVWVLKNYTLDQNKYKVSFKLRENSNNYLVLFAHNLGSCPPNTAALRFHDGEKFQEITLKSDLGECGAINFVYQKGNDITGYSDNVR